MDKKKNILVVDDQENMCWILSKIFIEEGFNVITALTGYEGIRQLNGNEGFSVAILDYRLPDMDGLQLMKKIKSQCPEVSVIIITSYGTSELREKAIELGAAAYFDKPFDNKKMMKAVKKALGEEGGR